MYPRIYSHFTSLQVEEDVVSPLSHRLSRQQSIDGFSFVPEDVSTFSQSQKKATPAVSSESETLTNGSLEESPVFAPLRTGTWAGGDVDIDFMSNEQEILDRQLRKTVVKVGLGKLYRYTTGKEKGILLLGAIMAIVAGTAQPLMTLIFGALSGDFQDFLHGTLSQSDFKSLLSQYTVYYVYLAIGQFIAVYISTVGFNYGGERAAVKIRERYLRAILSQNVAYFDMIGAGEITASISRDATLVQEGISEKVALTLVALSTTATAFIISFVKYWRLTLILISSVFALLLVTATAGKFLSKFRRLAMEANSEAATFSEEVFSSIRNVVAFNAQDKMAEKYDTFLLRGERWGVKQQGVFYTMFAAALGILFWQYGLALWKGSDYIVEGDIDFSSVLTIILCMMMGALSLSNVAPHARALGTAVHAGTKIFSIIDRDCPLDASSDAGRTLASVEGHLEVKNLKHIYPSRQDVTVLDNISLDFPAGKVTALVGASGSGKSTIIGLLERFYEPVAGKILLDGHDIRSFNIRWLRQQFALVGQEPVLFRATVFENISYGVIGTEHEHLDQEKKRELVINAAKMANANEFITNLSEGYDTILGVGGVALSGGEKQRIAIARAVVSNPKILLLDEATSALDTQSEELVQQAIDKAAHGRTTVIIAHRLSTVKNADNIIVMEKGLVVEQGTHDELFVKKGAYHKLAEAQHVHGKELVVRNITRRNSKVKRRYEYEKELQTAFMTEKFFLDPPLSVIEESASMDKLSSGGQLSQLTMWELMKMIVKFNKQEIPIMIVGLFFSVIAGGGIPTQAVLFAEAITALALPPTEYDSLLSEVSYWSLMHLMLGFVILLANTVQGWSLAYCTERLIHNVRNQVFRALLRQDISYHDQHSSGEMTDFLFDTTEDLAGMGGVTLGSIFSVITTLTAVVLVPLAIGWKLALVCISTLPLIIGSGFLEHYILKKGARRRAKVFSSSAEDACEAISAIRTVATLTMEDELVGRYKQTLDNESRISLKATLISAIFYALSQSLRFCCMALTFWYGGTLISNYEYTIFQFYVCYISIILGAQSAAIIFAHAPDMTKSRHAGQAIQNLLDRKPEVDAWSKEGGIISADTVQGAIEFKNVHFHYPTRPGKSVLRGFNITAKPGQYIALVGASGCGKSTAITHMERFYTPSAGHVYLDGQDIAGINVKSYRKSVALVNQEPTLYQGSVRDNLLLGIEEGEHISEERFVKACKDANIYDYILSLPDGFNTNVGSKGCLLSGGQKQRLAIARALITNPKILLLDEATSALDSTSETIVQAALDQAAKGRTTIAIAHRLKTIQAADVIYVVDKGRVVEKGTHDQLMAKHGRYREMVKLQSLSETQEQH